MDVRTDTAQHRLLSLIEAAQREGHSEDEIVALVEEHLGEDSGTDEYADAA